MTDPIDDPIRALGQLFMPVPVITVRQYFIAAAMQGLLSASHGPGCLLPKAIQQIAIDAVTVADATLAEAAK